ncbi:MAG: S8 family peptidase [Bacteroidota bacterium]
MKLFFRICPALIIGLGLLTTARGQAPAPVVEGLPQSAPTDWHLLDPSVGPYQGISLERAYEEVLKGKTPEEIVVAVIDGGIDIEHEDLDGVIWTNPGEIPDNNQDDDGNGYVDDIHGWNFIGGPDGSHVDGETLELTREYVKLKPKFENAKPDELSKKELAAYTYFKELEEEYEAKQSEAEMGFNNMLQYFFIFAKGKQMAEEELGEKPFTAENVQALAPANDTLKEIKPFLVSLLEQGATVERLQSDMEYFQDKMEYHYNVESNFREIVQDNPDDPNERYYGNNDVEGPDADHGTHVAGIIAAERGNEVGMDGVANSVKIMALRAVPNGDERDKDIANAIRYAVDNGAKIINMSFGKDYSPNKSVVDAAVKYAQKKKVLLIHAAGNEGADIDYSDNFPTKSLKKAHSGKYAKNWIEVGANSWGRGGRFVASFSNYGDNTVDVFAPGVDIYSTIPDSKYDNFDGTSMASPVVAGVAAVIWSYFPELKYKQVKKIILESAIRYPGKQVKTPGGGDKVDFDELSITGGIVNLYEAVKMADEMTK